MRIILKSILLLMFVLFGYGNSFAQTLAEIEKQANELFQEEAFVKAGKLYLKIISDPQRRKDHDLNFKYGTCLLHGKGPQKEEAIKFLSYSVKKPSIDKRAYYFLGVAYQYNYQFDKAITQYKRFKKSASSSQLKKYNVDVDIKSCNNGKKLLSNVTEMIVIKKTAVKAEDFYQLYKTNNIGGTILVYDEFQTKYDKKMGHRPIIHFPKNSPYVYYSSYGADGSTGLDIYVVQKLPNGKWSLSTKVVGGVNTVEDENYPYMNPNGKYLYFSSKGHNTMGGYDVFRSKYISGDNSFSKPYNMDFAVSSPDDDIFYIVDSLDRQAYFASARESEQGKLTVYNVRVEKIPMQLAVIKGDFINEILASNKIIEVIVTDFSSGNEIGTYKSKPKDGGLLMTFPKSGRYNFIMTVEGEDITHQAVITIPYLKEFRPLKMSIKHQNDANNEHVLVVEQLFDERFENPTAILAEVYKEMSKLPPNSSQFNIDSLDQISGTDDVFVDAGLDPFVTKEDIEKVIGDRITELDQIIDNSQENAYIAYHLAEENLQTSERKIDEANALLAKANQSDDPAEKSKLLEQVYVLNESAKADKIIADNNIELGNILSNEVDNYKGQLLEAKKASLNVKSTNGDDRVALSNSIIANESFFNNQIKNKNNTNVLDEISNDGHSVQIEYSELNDEILALEKQKENIEKSNNLLTKDLANTKKKKEITRLKNKIASNNSELDVLTDVISKKQSKLNSLDNTSSDSADLTRAAKNVRDPKFKTDKYTKAIHPNDIAKIKNSVKSSSVSSDIALLDESLTLNNVAGKYVSLTGLDESRTDFTEKQWADAYDEEIIAQKKLLKNASETDKAKIQGIIERLEKSKAEKTGGNLLVIENQGDSEFFKGEIINNYTERTNSINAILNESDRKKAENKLNKEIADKAKLKIEEINKQLKSDPNNVKLVAELSEYENILKVANESIDNNNRWLSGDGGLETNNKSIDEFVSESLPAYQTKLNDIESSPRTFEEKEKAIKLLNESTLANVDEQIQEKNALLNNDESNQSLKNEIRNLTEVKNKLEGNPDIAIINTTQISDITDVSSKVSFDDLYPGYQPKIDNIKESNDITEVDKSKQILSINKTVLSRINNQIEELELELQNNPKNSKTINKRIKNLELLKIDIQQKIEINKSDIKANSVIETNPNTVENVEKINPNYNTLLDDINKIENKEDRANAIVDLNKSTIRDIDDRIDKINKDLNSKPNDYNLLQEKVGLNNLRNNLENEIAENSQSDFSNVSATVVAEDIIPGFYSKLNAIDNQTSAESAKAQQRVNLHQQLVSKIDIQITKLYNYLGTGPDNDKVITKRIKNLEKLRANSEMEIVTNLKKIDDVANFDKDAIADVNDINPEYNKDLKTINSISDKADKKEALDKLNKSTIKKVNSKIREIKLELKSNPDVLNAEGLKQEQLALTNLKDKLQTEIDGENQESFINVDSEVTPNDLIPTYESDIESIKVANTKKTQKSQDRITLNNQLINKIDADISKMNSYSVTNPTNIEEVNKRVVNLNKLKDEAVEKIDIDQKILDADPDQLTLDNNAIADVNTIAPQYNTQYAKIKEIDIVDEQETKLRNLNNETISKIDFRLEQIKTQLEFKPNNFDLKQEKIALNNLRNKFEEENKILSKNSLQYNYASISPKVNNDDLVPDYTSKMADIELRDITDEEEADEKIKLNNNLISKIDTEIVGLNNYLESNPINKKDVEKRLKNLKSTKTRLQNDNKDLNKIKSANVQLTPITISSLMPTYQPKVDNLNSNSNIDEATKLSEINKLNYELISKIEVKTIELEELIKTSPENKKQIESQISKLNELKEAKLAEITANNQVLQLANNPTETNVVRTAQVKNITTEDYSTEEAKELVEEHKNDFETINKLEDDITNLKTQKENADSDKEKAKIEKKIIKKAIVKAKIENEIIEDLAEVTKIENQIKSANVISLKNDVRSIGDAQDEDTKQADSDMNLAETKFKAATVLRTEASNEKDPIVVNEKLQAAIVLESEGNDLINKSKQTYKTAIVINEMETTNNVVVNVPENIDDRESTKMYDDANELDLQSQYYENRAIELADSSTTVKKKYKNAILIDVQKANEKAAELKGQANKLKQKADIIKEQEDELIASIPNKSTETNIESKTDIDDVVTTDTYDAYYKAKVEGDNNMNQARLIEEEILAKKGASKRKIKQAIVIGGGDVDTKNIKNDTELLKLQAEIEALTNQQEEFKNEAFKNYETANNIIKNSELGDEAKNDVIALTNKNIKPKQKNNVPDVIDPLLADFKAPTNLNQDIYRTTNVPVYNSINDIPVDALQPTGLVYKVQIGAFRKQPSKTYFDKFAPVSGQTLDNGITRYMVGYFTAFTPANTVKNQVRGLGDYKDAFVVAYFNGEKISMSKAKKIEANIGVGNSTQNNTNTNNITNNTNNVTSNTNANTNTDNNTSTVKVNTDGQGNISVEPTTDKDKEKVSYYTSTPNAAKANQVEIMSGLFFTVQIGVYSKPVSASTLFNISPLNSQLTPSNKIRYTTGVFNSVADANVLKSEVVSKGISDAFVTVYYNGKRITVAEGRRILNTQGEKVLFTNKNKEGANTNLNNLESDIPSYVAENVKYRLLIGTFINKVPNKYANFLFNTEGVEFETETADDGTIYLYTQIHDNLNSVKESLVEVSELGVEDMKIISYYNEDIITFEEGQNVVGNTQATELIKTKVIDGISADYLFYQPDAIYYKIQAVFQNEIPVDVAEAIFSLEEDTFVDEIDEEGNTVFQTNAIQTYADAQKELENYIQKGIINAELVAFHKYQKISIEKAKTIKGE